jgi:phage baseplate assembly protein W
MADSLIIFRDFDPNFALGPDGDIKTLTNVEAIYGSLENILLTVTGERVMLRRFPGLLYTMLFEPLVENSIQRTAESELVNTIQKWDNRIRVSRLNIKVNQDSDSVAIEGEFYIQGYDKIFTFQTIIK